MGFPHKNERKHASTYSTYQYFDLASIPHLSYPAGHPSRCACKVTPNYVLFVVTNLGSIINLQKFFSKFYSPTRFRNTTFANMKFFAILPTMVFAALVAAAPLPVDSEFEKTGAVLK